MDAMILLQWILLLVTFFSLAHEAHGSPMTTAEGGGQDEDEIKGDEENDAKWRQENASHPEAVYIDYYSILGLAPGESDMSTIKAAYRAMALKWHPDKVDQDKKSESEAMLMQINEAYETLSDYDRRNEYLDIYYGHESVTELMTRSSTALQTLLKLSKKMWEDVPQNDRQEFVFELKRYITNKDDLQHDANLIFNNKNMLRGVFRAGVLAITVMSGFALLGAGFFSFTVLKTANEVLTFVFKVVTFPLKLFFLGGRRRAKNGNLNHQDQRGQGQGQQMGGGGIREGGRRIR